LYSKENVSEEVLDEMVEQALEIALLPKTRQAAERLDLLRSRFAERNRDKITARPALARNSGTGWWMYQVKDETLDLIRQGHLKSPTLVVWGVDDPGAPYKLGLDLFELVRQSVSRAQFHLFNDCSHWPFVEYPQDMTDLLVHFISNSSP
jgi:pimeloyl-ACP methyl ester carboxylesterase